MSTKRVEYHEGATADVKSAVAWYQRHSAKAALDFIEELQRAVATILQTRIAGPQARTTPGGSCSGDSLFRSFIRKKNP
jgi:plasmid stabilization system protein ParE